MPALIWGLSARQAAMLAGILVVTAVVYAPNLRNGWVVDDWEVFVNNKLIHSWSFVTGIRSAMTAGGFAIRAACRRARTIGRWRTYGSPSTLLFGANPAPWHLAKIVLHVVVVVLCFRAGAVAHRRRRGRIADSGDLRCDAGACGAVVFASAIPEPLSTVFELGDDLYGAA